METKKINVNGLEIKTSVNENEFEERKNGTYEKKYVDWFIDNSDDIDLFLDVGAFTSYYGLHMAKNGVRVIGIEPSEEAHEVSVENFEMNNFDVNDFEKGTGPSDHYIIHRVAHNTDKMEIVGGVGGCNFFETKSNIEEKGKYKVETTRIRMILSKLSADECAFNDEPLSIIEDMNIGLKVDTEGMEFEALEGIGVYWDTIKYACVEFHPMYIDDNEITKTLNLLEDKNMTQLDIDCDPYNDNCNIRFVKDK